jgi:hypothetical protein
MNENLDTIMGARYLKYNSQKRLMLSVQLLTQMTYSIKIVLLLIPKYINLYHICKLILNYRKAESWSSLRYSGTPYLHFSKDWQKLCKLQEMQNS